MVLPPLYSCMSSRVIGDDSVPVYRFDWDDGESRTTDEIDAADKLDGEDGSAYVAVESLAQVARQKDECDVTLIGFE